MYQPKVPRKLTRREKTNLSSGSESDKNKEQVHVYCRLRPLLDDRDQPCVDIVSPTVVSIISPPDKISRDSQHVFHKVFAPGSTQKEVFETVAYPMIEDLLQGKNGLLFTYGVTGSGKTYTVSGDYKDPGLIPRAINTLFNTISNYQATKYLIKSDKMNGFEIQTEKDAANDRLLESKSSSSGSLKRKVAEQRNFSYANDEMRVNNFNDKNLYSVFISYVEIYNNIVFDLLDEADGKTLQSKILREDYLKNMYVNNMVEIEVKSAMAAFEVLHMGQKRKRVGHTLLNAESSRSHSIFNIRVVQLEKEVPGQVGLIPETNCMKIGQLSLVDLAGSERCSRTQNTGMRLKEASSINNSLMSLRACMEILRDNQINNANRLVPYRDTRLTLYFKNYFEGDGRVQMIVCVNPSGTDYEENQQVMKFAEMSQEVKINKGVSRYTPYGKIQKIKNTPQTPATVIKVANSAAVCFGPEIPKLKLNFNEPDECLRTLNNLLCILKARKEASAPYKRQCKRLEHEFRNRLVEFEKDNILAKSEIKSLNTMIKLEQDKIADLEVKTIDLMTKQNNLMAKEEDYKEDIRNLQKIIDQKDLRINRNYLEQERVKQKIELNKEKQSQELDDCLRRQREEFNTQMITNQIKLSKVKQLLENDFYPESPTQINQHIGETQTTNIQTYESEVQTLDNFEEFLKNRSARSRETTSGGCRRRSRSAGGVWLEHNSVKPLPLGTVLQPAMKKRKSVTKLKKASDVTNTKQSKYCLIAQEQDSAGELETKVYKADILPTCSGGAQVVFNDVERLKQESPTGTPQK
nr:kinesin-like protein KIF23 [Onthophagus taurus]